MHNLLLWIHTLCMNDIVTNALLLVSSSELNKQLHVLCFVQGQDQKSEQKHTIKELNDEFHNHSPLLHVTMT